MNPKILLVLLVGLMSGSAFAQATSDPCLFAGAQSLDLNRLAGGVGQSRQAMQPLAFSDSEIAKGLELNKNRRLKVICEIKQAVLEKYSLIGLKKERLNIDADQLMQNCARTELATESNDRQEFLDRVQMCIAGFQDTHFGGYARVARPLVMTAIMAAQMDGKVYIARQSPLLIAKIKAGDSDGTLQDLEATLAPGNEITKIDGVPAVDAVATLLPYQSSSSLAFAQMLAANQYFVRSFKYPDKKTVAVEIRTAKGELKHLELPWMVQLGKGNFDARVKFRNMGLPEINQMRLKYNPVLAKFEKDDSELFSVGYNSRKPLFADNARLVAYNDDSGAPGLRVGEVVLDRNHVFCYMELMTFYSAKFTPEGTKVGQPFFEPIVKFVANCEAKGLPLLLDLKSNGGGYGSYPPKLLSVLSPKGAQYGGTVMGFRVSPSTTDLLTQDDNPDDTGARNLDIPVDTATVFSALSDALAKGAAYTDVLNNKDIRPALPNGYNQKIVAIVTPTCISACDMTANLLKTSGRAVLIGTAANGTGAGFEASETKLSSDFLDSEGQLQFRIPNFLFGVAPASVQDSRIPYEIGKQYLMENHPTVADVHYELTPQDLATQGKSLGEAAVTELFK